MHISFADLCELNTDSALQDKWIAGGCDQPAAGCEAHHVVHRADGGRTSLTNLKDYCRWHHHVVLHQLGGH